MIMSRRYMHAHELPCLNSGLCLSLIGFDSAKQEAPPHHVFHDLALAAFT